MTIEKISRNQVDIALVQSDVPLITDIQTALDLMATVRYETGCDRMALPKSAFTEDFFVLSTRLAGEVLQKFVNYQMKVAIFGDYSHYTSKPLKDFIYESNSGSRAFFVATEEEAVEKLAAAK